MPKIDLIMHEIAGPTRNPRNRNVSYHKEKYCYEPAKGVRNKADSREDQPVRETSHLMEPIVPYHEG